MTPTKAFVATMSVCLLFSAPVFAEAKIVVPFSVEQADAGFEAKLEGADFSLSVPKKVISGKGSVSLGRVESEEFPEKPFAVRVSDVFEYHIHSAAKGAFAQSLSLALPLIEESDTPVRVHFFDAVNNVWRPLPSQMKGDGVVEATTRFSFSKVAAFRDEALRVSVSSDEVKNEKTIESPDGSFAMTLPKKSLSAEANVVVKRFDSVDTPFPEGTTMVSGGIYEYNIRGEKLKIAGSFRVTLSYAQASSAGVSVYVLDKAHRVWKKIPSTLEKENEVSVETALLYAPLVVLKEDAVFDGVASWYSGNDVTDASTNHFPIGTKVRVTNTDTGAFVDVKVVSTWKGVEGRVIDLTRSAFAKIARLGAGVVKVRIEKI